jgi:iron complex outermembrane receptor protein|tara:strand:- start:164 stop:2857 length:2694 start_codon:yes stop_codon:yes gene_type:complete
MKKFFWIFLILNLSFAIGQTISGTVTDENGNGLAGANVSVEGTNMGAAANSSGSYTISGVGSGSYTLTASFIGYSSSSKSVNVGEGGATANFSLTATALAGAGVFVTGTRAAGRTAMKSPTPIDGFDDQTLRRQGNGDMTETLKNQVPSFNATPLTGDGAAFVRPTSMRGLPPDNILVLTNSKRRHRSALISHFGAAMNVGAQAVDVAMIPSIAVKRLEVLRDGASAQYGSDAIAGVMNFILKDNNEGVQFQVTSGQWMTAENGRGGERDVTAAANIGLPLSDDGFLNISAEYAVRPELSRGFQHASAADGYKGWVQAADGTNADGHYTGTQNVDDWQTAMNWGRPENNGFRSVWNAGMEVGDGIEAYSFGNYADTYGEYSFFLRAPGKSGALTAIPLDPTDPSKGNYSWGDTYPLGFTPRLEGHGTDFSAVVGVKGEDLAGIGLNYDFSTSYGSNYIHYNLRNTLNLSWGPNSPHDFEIGDLQQSETNLNADFTYPMGNMNVAFGAESREEKYTMYRGQKEAWMAGPWGMSHLLVDPVASAAADSNVNYTAPGLASNGMPGTSPDAAGVFARQNTAYYGDIEYDMDALLVQAAVRFEDFSDFGTTTNFKVAGRYSLGNLATFRGGYSTGFRAPTPGQSNYTGVVTSFDGLSGQQIQEGTLRPDDPLSVLMGGAPLVPEDAVNLSAGFTTSMLSGLNLSIDYYQIDVTNKIIKSRSLTVPEGSSPTFTDIAIYTNALDTKTSGIDVVADYTLGNTNIGLAVNNNATEVITQRQVNGVDPVSEGGVHNIENNLPKMRISSTVTQSFGDALSLMVRVNYYSETKDERSQQEVVDPTQLVDVELNYRVSDNLSVVFGANNALNTFPNQIATRRSQGMPYPRRTPIGYHGGMMFTRLSYNF